MFLLVPWQIPQHVKQHKCIISQSHRPGVWVDLAGFAAPSLTRLKSRYGPADSYRRLWEESVARLIQTLANPVPCSFKTQVLISLLAVSWGLPLATGGFSFISARRPLYPRTSELSICPAWDLMDVSPCTSSFFCLQLEKLLCF